MNEKIKDRYMTMRLPADVERELRKMAAANTRTLAAQILHYVKQGLENEKNSVIPLNKCETVGFCGV